MILNRIIGNCSKCQAINAYGILYISNNSILYGCKSCKTTHLRKLPDLRKKIIYLDQFFLSKVFRKSDSDFLSIAEKLKKLAHYQAIVCPYSTAHESETHQWRREERDELFKFIKQFSGGHDFIPDYDVEMTQLKRSYKAFLKGDSPQIELIERDALADDVHHWDDYIWIDVGRYVEDIELIRNLKNEVANGFVDAVDEWKNKELSFGELLAHEVGAWRDNIINSFLKSAPKVLNDPLAFLEQPIISQYLLKLSRIEEAGQTPDERMRKIMQFLQSDYIRHIPFVDIFSRIHALLRYKVQQGQFPTNTEKIKRTVSGLFYDAKFISVYAPYCDAIFVDNLMHQWLIHEKIDIQSRYSAKVFSKTNLKDFNAYIDIIETNIPPEQQEIVREIY